MKRFNTISSKTLKFLDTIHEVTFYYDIECNSIVTLDNSYVEQEDSFHHPYTGEEIFFDDHEGQF